MFRKISFKSVCFFLFLFGSFLSLIVKDLNYFYRKEIAILILVISVFFFILYGVLSYKDWADTFRQKKNVKQFFSFFSMAIFLITLIFVYAILKKYPYQIDFTKNKIYSLSKKSKDMVSKIQPIQFILWELDSEQLKNDLNIILNKYRGLNPEKIDVRNIKANYQPHLYKMYNKKMNILTVKSLAPLKTITSNQWETIMKSINTNTEFGASDIHVLKEAYVKKDSNWVLKDSSIENDLDRLKLLSEVLEKTIGYTSKYANIDQGTISKSGYLTYAEIEITNKIRNVSMSNKGSSSSLICMVGGHGEKSFKSEYNHLAKVLSNDFYTTKEISLTNEKDFEQCHIIFIAGPKKPFFKNEIENLKKYSKKENSRLFMLTDPNFQYLRFKDRAVSKVDQLFNDIKEIVSNYSIVPNEGFLYDELMKNVFNVRQDIFIVLRVLYKAIYSKNHPIVKDLIESNIPSLFLGIQTFNFNNANSEFRISPFLESTSSGWIEKNIKTNDQMKNTFDANVESKKVYHFGLTAVSVDKKNRKLVLIGDSDFASNTYFQNNQDLFLNSLYWLSDQKNKITIQPKKALSKAKVIISANTMSILRLSFIAFIPSFFLLIAFFVYKGRKS